MPPLLVGRANLQSRDNLAVSFHLGERQLSRLAAIGATKSLRPEMLAERPIKRGARHAVELGGGLEDFLPVRVTVWQALPMGSCRDRASADAGLRST